MARPPLPIGTPGRIRWYRTELGWRARCVFRDYDGVSREVQRVGKTKYAAESNLKAAMRDRGLASGGADITSESRLAVVAEAWYSSLTDLSPGTMQTYRYVLDTLLLPALAKVKLRELTPGLVDRHLTSIKNLHGPSMAKSTRSVLSGVCGLACRHDAMTANPCKSTGKISAKPKKPPTALEADRARALMTKLREDKVAVERDIPDLVAYLLATGCRIGEASALRWSDLDLDEGIVEVRGTVLRITGQGLVIKPTTKSAAGQRILELPSWCIEMLKARSRDTATVFPAPKGGLRDPSNTNADLRVAFSAAGEPGLTSHGLRKTTATLLDEAKLSGRQVADQLGHSKPSMTQDVYLGRKRRATGAAEVLEQLG